MGWSVGFDMRWRRDIGYGVVSQCDHPECRKKIDRGLAFVCGAEPYGGDEGCGLFFCLDHLLSAGTCGQLCERCAKRKDPFTPKPDSRSWLNHKLRHPSWQGWRDENPDEVAETRRLLASSKRK